MHKPWYDPKVLLPPRLTLAVFAAAIGAQASPAVILAGHVNDPQGKPIPHALVSAESNAGMVTVRTVSREDGSFQLDLPEPGPLTIYTSAAGFEDLTTSFRSPPQGLPNLTLTFAHVASQNHSVNVTADLTQADIEYPDPATRVYVREQILDANPGRPGAPVSIPGYPIETASGGIKAPQYFAPGVAGDHGEPIAQYFQVGSYLVPNNLSSNAHGNGYADPNVMIPLIVESVQVDGGAFNVREGNHAVNLAAIYGFRDRLEPFVTLTGDYRDLDLAAGCSPEGPAVKSFFAIQASFGNGFLDRLEHRQQYKFNAFRVFPLRVHQLTLLAMGYYGEARIPGLVPLDIAGLRDTIDPRQRDQTHTGEFVVNDVWKRSPSEQFQTSAFFRSYNLSLFSDFGAGLIRQSEFRTVVGGNETYIRKFTSFLSVLAGVDYLREAPRRLDLDRYLTADSESYGPFQKVTANDVTLNFVTPFVALDGNLTRWLRYDLGWRRDQLNIENRDLLNPANSSRKWVAIDDPKATLSATAPENSFLPSASFSFGQTFFSNDPRMGNGATEGTRVSRAHSYRLLLSKKAFGTELKLTAGRLTQEQSLAKIDPDTGLQFVQGPSRNFFLILVARRSFCWGSLQGSFAKADARDLASGLPVPEAPRLIADFLGTIDRLPFHLHGRVEFEEVGRKPLGDEFVSVPVQEFRAALARPFWDGRLNAAINFLISRGYTGQTTEVLALPGEPEPLERVVGIYLPSYISASVSYHFRPRTP